MRILSPETDNYPSWISGRFFSPFSIAITSLGEERANLSAFRTFDLCLFWFVCFLFLLGSGKGCDLWLWHSLDFSLNFCLSVSAPPVMNKCNGSLWDGLWLWILGNTSFWESDNNCWFKRVLHLLLSVLPFCLKCLHKSVLGIICSIWVLQCQSWKHSVAVWYLLRRNGQQPVAEMVV